MRLALCLLALVLPTLGFAQDGARHAWGAPTGDRGPSVLLAMPCDFPCFAVVRFDNTVVDNSQGALILVDASSSLTHEATLVFDGVPIAVVVEQGGQRLPDVLRVRPPLGYMVEPTEVVVKDDTSGSVRVVLVPVG